MFLSVLTGQLSSQSPQKHSGYPLPEPSLRSGLIFAIPPLGLQYGTKSVQRIIIAWCLILLPHLSLAAPCPDFPWHYPSEMVEPELVMQARTAMEEKRTGEAQELLRSYLTDHAEGVFAEGSRFALASLPRQESDPDKEFLKIIDRLSDERESHTDSVYAPWALCRIGELYGEVGWYAEANTTFEEFLELYPDDPLAEWRIGRSRE